MASPLRLGIPSTSLIDTQEDEDQGTDGLLDVKPLTPSQPQDEGVKVAALGGSMFSYLRPAEPAPTKQRTEPQVAEPAPVPSMFSYLNRPAEQPKPPKEPGLELGKSFAKGVKGLGLTWDYIKSRVDRQIEKFATGDTKVTDALLAKSAEEYAAMESDPRIAEMVKIGDEADSTGSAVKEMLGFALRNPTMVANFIAEQIPGMAVGGGVGGVLTAPLKAGAVNLATKAGLSAAGRAAAGMAPVGAGINTGAVVFQSLGTNYADGLQKFDGDDEKASDYAIKKTAGEVPANAVAGAFIGLKPFAGTGMLGKAGNVLAQGTIQGTGGAAGAATASLAVGEDISRGELLLEFLGEFATAPGDILMSRIGKNKSDQDNASRIQQYLNQVEDDPTTDSGRQQLFDAMMQDPQMSAALKNRGIQSADDPNFDSVAIAAQRVNSILGDIEIPTAEQRAETTKQRGEDVAAAFGDTASTGVGVGTGTGDPVIQRDSVVANPETRTLDPVNGQAPAPVTLPDGAGARAGTQAMSGEDLVSAQQGFEVESAFNVGTGQIANRFKSQAQAETFLFGPVGQDGKRTGGYASSVPDLEFQIRRGQTSKDAGGNAFFFVESRPAAPAPAPAAGAPAVPAPAAPAPAPVPAAGAPAPAAPAPAAPAPAAAAPAAPAQAPAAAPSPAPVNLASVAWDAFGGAKFDTLAPAVQQEWTEAVGEGYKPEVLSNLYRNLSAPATTGAAPATTGAAPGVAPSATAPAAPTPAPAPTQAAKPVEPATPPAPPAPAPVRTADQVFDEAKAAGNKARALLSKNGRVPVSGSKKRAEYDALIEQEQKLKDEWAAMTRKPQAEVPAAAAAPTEATKPVEPKAPPAPAPAVTSAKKPTLRVTQYQDGSFGLDWLDRGGRPAVERTFKTEQEARDAAKQFGADEPVAPDVYVRPASAPAPKPATAPAPKPAAEASAPTPAAQKAIDAGRMVQARNQWWQYAPEGVKFESLSDENRVRWRDAVEAGKPNMELANELSGVKPEPAPAPTPAAPKQTVEQKVKAKQKAKKAAPVEVATKKVPESEAIEIWDGNDPEDGSHIAWSDLPADVKADWKAAVEDGYANTPEYDKLVERVRKNERADRANAKAAENQKKDDITLRATDGSAPAQSVSVERAQLAVDKTTENWANLPKINVVASESQLPIKIVRALARANVLGTGKVKGLFHNGEVWVIASNNANLADVIVTVAHEVAGHYGLRQILGDSYTKVMNDIYKGNKQARALADKMMAKEGLTLEVAVEEVLADMAEQGVTPENRSALQKIFAVIRQVLRKLGVPYVTDSDMKELVANARRYVMDGDVKEGSGEKALGTALRSDGTKPTFYSAMERAFRDSKMPLDKNGAASPQQWKSWLASNKDKLRVKKEEIEWTGINEWLDTVDEFMSSGGQKAKVTKEQILKWIADNRVNVNDVLLTSYGRPDTDVAVADIREPDETDLREFVRDKLEAMRDDGVEDIGDISPDDMTNAELREWIAENHGWGTFLNGFRRQQERFQQGRIAKLTRPKHGAGNLVLKGGKNYAELVLFDPTIESYAQQDDVHFGDVSRGKAIGWLRMNERQDKDGNTVLFIEELQSKRAQDLRKLGDSEVPDAPFIKKTEAWTGLLLKRAIAYAQSRGLDRVVWTTGEQQNDRYKLTTYMDTLEVVAAEDGKSGWQVRGYKDGKENLRRDAANEKELAEVLNSEELAKKAIEDDGLILEGKELELTESDLRPYYNTTVPSVAKGLLKEFGGKVEVMEIEGTGQQLGFVIPESLQQTVEEDGLPLFRRDDYESQFDDVPAETREMAKRKGTVTPPTIRERLEALKPNLSLRLVQGVFDKVRSVKDISEKAYMQLRLSASVDGALETLLHLGQVFNDGGALNLKKGTKGLIEVMQPLAGETDRFLMWVAANRAGELKKQDRELFFTDDEVTKLKKLNLGQMKDGRQRVAVYAETLRGMNELNRSVLDVARQSGLIDEAAYKKFASDVWYVPFYRYMEDDGTLSAAATSSGNVNQYFSKMLKGSERPLNDLMQNTLMNWSHILSASMKNAGSVETLKAASDLGGIVTRIEPINGTMGKDKDGKVHSLKDTAKVMEGGKAVHYDIDDPFLLQSLTAVAATDKNGFLLNIGRTFKTTLTRFVALNPTFKTNQLIRDSVQSIGLSDLGYNPVDNVVQGVKEFQNNRGEALAGGGIFTMGNAFDGDRGAATKRLLAKGVKADDIIDTPEKAKKLARELWDKYDEVSDAMENANRLALYRQMRDSGASHLEAAFAARDIQDYTSMGAWTAIRYANQLLPYFNARLQGLYKIGRDGVSPLVKAMSGSANESERKKAAKFATVTAAVTAAGLMLYLGQKDDEEWKKREDWDRDMFFWFRIPGTDRAIRIPKPFEMGAIATIAERALEQIVDKNVEGKVFGQRMMALLHDTFAMNPIPQVVRPLQEIAANKNGLTDAPIETLAQKRLSADERVAPRTSAAGIALNRLNSMVAEGIGAVTGMDPETMKLSPIQYDYMLKAYLGWVGTVIQTSSYYAAQGVQKGEMPDMRTDDLFFVGNYVRDLPANQSRYVTDFYKTAEKAARAGADYRSLVAQGKEQEAEALAVKREELLALEPAYESAKKQLTDINNQIKAIERDEEMTGAEKRKQIDELYQERSNAAKEVELARIRMKRGE